MDQVLADVGFADRFGRAHEVGDELAAVKQINSSRCGAKVTENEVLCHALVEVSPKDLPVKDKVGPPGS
jgi:hypothetical protein